MAKKNITISDNEGVILHPLTVASQVVMDGGGTLDVYLDELDTNINTTIGNKVEEVINENTFATKAYVDAQVATPVAEVGVVGKSRLATLEDITEVEADASATNSFAIAVTPYTLTRYVNSKGFMTSSEVDTAVNTAVEQGRPKVSYQPNQPATADSKEGDIWIKSS